MNKNSLNKLKNKTILITGGTGSFGNTVVSTLIKLSPKRVIIFSRDEKKQFDMRNKYDSPLLRFIIGDVRDRESVEKTVKGVDYIFHAAALKQVPSCEFFPMEAIKTNILGASNILNSASSQKIQRVVMLSTDKAVYPINAMGMTKALMEKIMLSYAKSEKIETIVCGVRYGNVLYSRGSVVPYFIECMKQKKYLPVTNLSMTRFLLTLEDSIDLVLHALTEGNNGNIYVRKSPAATLETLAKALCKIFNYNIGYKEVGVRVAEKIHETLISEEEMFRTVDLGNYYEIPPESQDLDYNKYFFRGKVVDVNKIKPYASDNTQQLNVSQTKELLLSLPEIQHELKIFKNKAFPKEEIGTYTILDH